MEKIKSLIDSENFEDAKNSIERLELLVVEETSNRIRENLVFEIKFLKNYYHCEYFKPSLNFEKNTIKRIDSISFIGKSSDDNVRLARLES